MNKGVKGCCCCCCHACTQRQKHRPKRENVDLCPFFFSSLTSSYHIRNNNNNSLLSLLLHLPFFTIMLESIPGWVFITGVSLLIATIAYSSQLFILLPAMEWWSPTAAKLLIPFNLLVLMVYYNYYLACTTDPGKVPNGWVNTIDSSIALSIT